MKWLAMCPTLCRQLHPEEICAGMPCPLPDAIIEAAVNNLTGTCPNGHGFYCLENNL